MPDTYPLPAERIAHAIAGAIKLARNIATDPTLPESVRSDADKIILAVFDIPSDAEAMMAAIERRDEDMKSVLASNCQMAQEITQLRVHAAESSQSAPIQIPLTVEPPHRAASGE